MKQTMIEEGLLVLLALVTFSFLMPASLPRSIVGSVLAAILMIVLLSIRFHAMAHDHITPYDKIFLVGVLLSLLHLLSFTAFFPTLLSKAIILVFSAFYVFLAVVLYEHKSWFFRQHVTAEGTPLHQHHLTRHAAKLMEPHHAHHDIVRHTPHHDAEDVIAEIHEVEERHRQEKRWHPAPLLEIYHANIPHKHDENPLVRKEGSELVHKLSCSTLRSTPRSQLSIVEKREKGMQPCGKCRPF